MVDRLGLAPGQAIDWKFQVEQQRFITRYGTAGGLYFKQTVLQSKNPIFPYPIKRISKRIYETAKRIAEAID